MTELFHLKNMVYEMNSRLEKLSEIVSRLDVVHKRTLNYLLLSVNSDGINDIKIQLDHCTDKIVIRVDSFCENAASQILLSLSQKGFEEYYNMITGESPPTYIPIKWREGEHFLHVKVMNTMCFANDSFKIYLDSYTV